MPIPPKDQCALAIYEILNAVQPGRARTGAGRDVWKGVWKNYLAAKNVRGVGEILALRRGPGNAEQAQAITMKKLADASGPFIPYVVSALRRVLTKSTEGGQERPPTLCCSSCAVSAPSPLARAYRPAAAHLRSKMLRIGPRQAQE